MTSLRLSSQTPRMTRPVLVDSRDPGTDWVARIRAGDEGAFAELFRAYHPALCSYAYARVGSAAEAEEIVMDVFRRLWERRMAWAVTGSLRGYLFSATEHGVVSHIRHRKVERSLVHDVSRFVRAIPGMGAAIPTPSETTEDADLATAIARAAEALPERCRAVFLLWQRELRYAEIAEALGISVKTVETQLARAVRELREKLAGFR